MKAKKHIAQIGQLIATDFKLVAETAMQLSIRADKFNNKWWDTYRASI